MALKLEEVRALAERVAASHGLDVVDVEYQGGGGKHRTLRVFIEKNEAERAKLRERVRALQVRREGAHGGAGIEPEAEFESESGADDDLESDEGEEIDQDADALENWSADDDERDLSLEENNDPDAYEDEDEAFLDGLPHVASLEFLSGITHGDCEAFSRDFGTVLDIEELVPGTEYLLEVSSPGLDRRLSRPADYQRFTGSLVKLQTFEAVGGNRHWQGRITELAGETLVLAVSGKQASKKAKKGPAPARIEIAFGNVEKAQLVPEF